MYGDIHRYFLQHVMAHGPLPYDSAVNFLNKLDEEESFNSSKLASLIIEINSEISKQSFKIETGFCEITGLRNVVFINISKDDITKHQSCFTAGELQYFHNLLKELITTEYHKVSVMACFNIKTATKQLSKDQIETLINKLTKMGYLVQKGDSVYLGIKTIMEFAPYIRKEYKGYVSNCSLCEEPVFAGSFCKFCKKIMHTSCLEKYKISNNKCLNCKKALQIESTIDENGPNNMINDSDED